jgi:hypothetical protein
MADIIHPAFLKTKCTGLFLITTVWEIPCGEAKGRMGGTLSELQGVERPSQRGSQGNGRGCEWNFFHRFGLPCCTYTNVWLVVSAQSTFFLQARPCDLSLTVL